MKAQASNPIITPVSAPPSGKPLVSFSLRAAAILLVILAMTWLSRHFALDDALIYARYIRNATTGHGLVFNYGEPVNALTSILDTWILIAAVKLAHGHVLLVETILSSGFLFAAALLAEETVPLAGIFVAASSFFYFCKGMETSLFIFVLMLCVHAYVRGRIQWLPTLCTLALLTRFEGGALGLIIAWQLWRQRKLPSLPAFLPPVLLVAFYLGFNFFFYHRLLPQSASAKFGQGMSGFWGEWPTAFFLITDNVFRPLGGSWMYLVVLIVLTWFARRDPRMKKMNEAVLPFLILLSSFYILFNIPSYFWYYAPFLYFLPLYAIRLIPETREAYIATAIVLVAYAQASATYVHRTDIAPTTYIATAKWLQENTPVNARIASVETGNIGWYCDRYLIDIVGLTTPANGTYTAHRDFSSWFKDRPDYIIVHPDLNFPWEKVALASPEYQMLPVHFGGVFILQHKTPASGSSAPRAN